jgi:hypothetical protein
LLSDREEKLRRGERVSEIQNLKTLDPVAGAITAESWFLFELKYFLTSLE